jgi:hypothetical protein
MNILKSIGAVLAGLIFIFVTHSGVDLLLESLGIFTPTTQRFETPWMLVTATTYRTLLSIGGCFVTGFSLHRGRCFTHLSSDLSVSL